LGALQRQSFELVPNKVKLQLFLKKEAQPKKLQHPVAPTNKIYIRDHQLAESQISIFNPLAA
jgi:hypothetical protein